MSHSTTIAISTASTTFTFRYDTRQPAEMLKLGVNQSIQLYGHEAASCLADIMGSHIAGKFETRMVKLILEQARADAEFRSEHDFRSQIEFDRDLRKTHDVLKTFENVIRSTFQIESQIKYTQSSLGLTTVETISALLDEALQSTTLGMSAKAVMGSIIEGFTGLSCTKESTQARAELFHKWLVKNHSEYMTKVSRSGKHEFKNIFELTVTHND